MKNEAVCRRSRPAGSQAVGGGSGGPLPADRQPFCPRQSGAAGLQAAFSPLPSREASPAPSLTSAGFTKCKVPSLLAGRGTRDAGRGAPRLPLPPLLRPPNPSVRKPRRETGLRWPPRGLPAPPRPGAPRPWSCTVPLPPPPRPVGGTSVHSSAVAAQPQHPPERWGPECGCALGTPTPPCEEVRPGRGMRAPSHHPCTGRAARTGVSAPVPRQRRHRCPHRGPQGSESPATTPPLDPESHPLTPPLSVGSPSGPGPPPEGPELLVGTGRPGLRSA